MVRNMKNSKDFKDFLKKHFEKRVEIQKNIRELILKEKNIQENQYVEFALCENI